MANKKKRSKCKAPQRRSTRERKQTEKYGGEYYDEHECHDIASTDEQGKPAPAKSSSINPVAPNATVEQGSLTVASSVQVSDSNSTPPTSTASTIISAVEKGNSIASSEQVLDAISTPSNIIINAAVSTVKQGICSAACSETMNDASCANPIDVPTPMMLSTPSMAEEKSTPTHSCRENTPETVLRKSCVKKPLNLQLELELAEEELAASFVADSILQPVSNPDYPDSVNAVNRDIVKEINSEKEDLEDLEDLLIDDDDFLTLCGFSDLYHISPYGSECFRQIFDGVYNHVVISACFDIEDAAKPGEKCVDKSEKARKREKETVTHVLMEAEQKREELHQLLLKEQMKNKKLAADCDALHQQLFQKTQYLKVADDRIKQLQNDNEYRRVVQRLEEKIQDLESERVDSLGEIVRQREEIDVIRENMSNLMNENTVLKNAVKQKKQQYLNSDTQTDFPKQCFSISVQTEECADQTVQTGCEVCAGDKKLTDELVEN